MLFYHELFVDVYFNLFIQLTNEFADEIFADRFQLFSAKFDGRKSQRIQQANQPKYLAAVVFTVSQLKKIEGFLKFFRIIRMKRLQMDSRMVSLCSPFETFVLGICIDIFFVRHSNPAVQWLNCDSFCVLKPAFNICLSVSTK